MNPYTAPESDPENELAPQSKIVSNKTFTLFIREFFSPAGSFTRLEFLCSGLIVFAIYMLWMIAYTDVFIIPDDIYSLGKWLIYLLWGFFIGKRAKTVGFNMSSGIVMGLLLPFMALIFIFQEGTKDKEVKAARLRLAAKSKQPDSNHTEL